MGQGGYVFSWGIPMLASRAHELGLEADIFHYYDLRAAWKNLARKKKQGYRVAWVFAREYDHHIYPETC